MSLDDVKQPRSWREIAEELAIEQEPSRVVELSKELIRAFDAEKTRKENTTTKQKVRSSEQRF
jgi:hypothetical protein